MSYALAAQIGASQPAAAIFDSEDEFEELVLELLNWQDVARSPGQHNPWAPWPRLELSVGPVPPFRVVPPA